MGIIIRKRERAEREFKRAYIYYRGGGINIIYISSSSVFTCGICSSEYIVYTEFSTNFSPLPPPPFLLFVGWSSKAMKRQRQQKRKGNERGREEEDDQKHTLTSQMKRNKRKKKYRKRRGKGRSGIEGEISDNIRPEWIVSFVISNRYKQSAAIQYI
jgi:hypothetical protein